MPGRISGFDKSPQDSLWVNGLPRIEGYEIHPLCIFFGGRKPFADKGNRLYPQE